MKIRIDHETARIVDLAIAMRESRGQLAAARYLDRHHIPIEVSLRVLSAVAGRCRAFQPSPATAAVLTLIKSRQ